MTADIAKAITLTTYGNAFLKDELDISELTLNHPSFSFTKKVQFLFFKRRFLRKPTWHIYAESPINWLEKLKQNGCQELRLVVQNDNSLQLDGEKIPDYKVAGFVGAGGKWLIQSVFGNNTDVWQSKEEVTNQNDPDKRIWTVNYGRTIVKAPTEAKTEYDLIKIKNELHLKLMEIREFAKNEDLGFWSDWFNEAIDLLNKKNPYSDEKDKLIVPIGKMELTSIQLLAGARKAWCFGGMGSWNDQGFRDELKQKNYEKLTSELYNIINLSFLAVANT